VQLRYSYRLYPTPGQRSTLARAFGCARVVFNDALAAREAAYKAGEPYIPDAALSKRLTVSKGTPERAWLAVPAQRGEEAEADAEGPVPQAEGK
jgi:putative transposase